MNGDIPRPENPKVVDVAGKTILPDFIDGHGPLEDFHGEMHPHLAIATRAQIEAYRDGLGACLRKKGPLSEKFTDEGFGCPAGIRGPLDHHEGSGSRTLHGNSTVRTEDEAREAVHRKHAMTCEITKLNEFLPTKLAKVVIDEAHSLGISDRRSCRGNRNCRSPACQMMREILKVASVQQAHKENRIAFTSLTEEPGRFVSAEGAFREGEREEAGQSDVTRT